LKKISVKRGSINSPSPDERPILPSPKFGRLGAAPLTPDSPKLRRYFSYPNVFDGQMAESPEFAFHE
jgi:hypothetical protein